MTEMTERDLFEGNFGAPVATSATSRTGGRARLDVQEVEQWMEDLPRVAQTALPGRTQRFRLSRPNGPFQALTDEASEAVFLEVCYFQNISILGHGWLKRRDAGASKALPDVIGGPGLASAGQLGLVGEINTKLRLHVQGHREHVVRMFNANPDSEAARVLRQLFYHMFMNDVCRGFVTSSERTYFVRVNVDRRSRARLQVSEPFLVGQPGYTRMLAWFVRTCPPCVPWKSCNWGGTIKFPVEESKASPVVPAPAAAPRKRADDGAPAGRSTRRRAAKEEEQDNLAVPHQLLHGAKLGAGRNGDVRAVALGTGPLMAVKEFGVDCTAAFHRELAAYHALHRLQGVFIPRLLFVGRTDGYERLLGLQLGRPLPDDLSRWSPAHKQQRAAALAALRAAGYEQTDADARNFVLLRGDDGRERVAVVDLESAVPLLKGDVLACAR